MTLKQLFLGKAAGVALLAAAGTSGAASAEDTPYLGQMTMVGQNWCPLGYSPMNGQLLSVASNQALFSLLGCTYGGDCRSTFALPDMRGRSPVGIDGSNGNYQWGSRGGAETQTMTVATMPSHNHRINASDRPGSTGSPGGNDLADFSGTALNGYTNAPPNNQIMASNTIGISPGSSQAFSIRQPYQVINYCIAIQGIFPSRN